MRRESSTVVVLVGEVGDSLLTALARCPSVCVVRDPAGATSTAMARPGWERGALAMRAAGRALVAAAR